MIATLVVPTATGRTGSHSLYILHCWPGFLLAHCVDLVNHYAEFEHSGGVAYADMLGRTNLIALVGGGQAPKFPDRNGKSSTVCPHVNYVHVMAAYDSDDMG